MQIIRPFCKTLSKALDMTWKMPLTSNPSSDDRYILWVIDDNWFIHEFTGIKPDWFEVIK